MGDRHHEDGIDYCIRLRDLGGRLPIPEWRSISWAECPDCGTGDPLTTADSRGAVYDGEPVVCGDCGAVGSTSVDEHGAHVSWRETESLTDSALAAFRRLMGVDRG